MAIAWKVFGFPTERDKRLFMRHLSSIVRLDSPFPDGLRLIAEEMHSRSFRKALQKIADDIELGNTISESFSKYLLHKNLY